MQKLERNVNISFRVTAREKDLIKQKMAQFKTNNLNAYMRKMAIDGYVINVDVSSISDCTTLLRNISNNINQIARRVNSTNNIYTEDMKNIMAQLDKIWNQQNEILRSLSVVLEAV